MTTVADVLVSTTPEPDACGVATTTDTASSGDALRTVAVLYGFWFAVTLTVYCLVRNRNKALYNVRDTVEELKCELASREYSPFSWIVGVMKVTEEEIFEQCGFDAVTYIRLLQLGTKLAMVGCFIAIWLCPTYKSAPTTSHNDLVVDAIDSISVGRVNPNDDRMFGSVIASWLINVTGMYLLYHEFEWFITERHKFMRQKTPQNYTVFIGGLPKKLCSVTALLRFLRVLFKEDLLEVQLARNIGKLETLVKSRDKLKASLEHDQVAFDQSGKRLHSFTLQGGITDSLSLHESKLEEATKKVNIELGLLEKQWAEHERRVANNDEDAIENPPDTIKDAAFVSFKTLQAATIALQVLHHRRPFSMLAQSAPRPEDVKWSNVGFKHWRLQFSSILAGALTGILIMVWTFPMVTVASFTKVRELKKVMPFLEDASDNMKVGDWRVLDELLAAVAPVAIITLNGWLPTILGWFCLLEGHIGEETLQASIFSKLTLFQLVQTFFVSAVAGSIMDQINCLIDDPAGQSMKILAKSLPAQAVTFMGLTIVQTTFGMAIELMRPFPFIYSKIRSRFGPNLTEEERKQDFLMFSPLSNPGNMDFTSLTSDLILMFITLFVYAILSPIASFISLIGFTCLNVGYRNQVFHVYDPSNDTGGALFPKVANYLVVCMLIAQVTVLGVVSLNEGSRMVPLMLPLLIVTILFHRYLQQQHLRVASTLPVMECHDIDEVCKKDDDYSFVSTAYRQESLDATRPKQDPGDITPERVFSNQAPTTLNGASATIGLISSLPHPVDREMVGWGDSFQRPPSVGSNSTPPRLLGSCPGSASANVANGWAGSFRQQLMFDSGMGGSFRQSGRWQQGMGGSGVWDSGLNGSFRQSGRWENVILDGSPITHKSPVSAAMHSGSPRHYMP